MADDVQVMMSPQGELIVPCKGDRIVVVKHSDVGEAIEEATYVVVNRRILSEERHYDGEVRYVPFEMVVDVVPALSEQGEGGQNL